jgi:hypothetical protein
MYFKIYYDLVDEFGKINPVTLDYKIAGYFIPISPSWFEYKLFESIFVDSKGNLLYHVGKTKVSLLDDISPCRLLCQNKAIARKCVDIIKDGSNKTAILNLKHDDCTIRSAAIFKAKFASYDILEKV